MRKKVFGIFGGFLAVMLVFTLLSRAVNGASMARVETVRISTGTIEHKVTGSGKVEAGKEVAVYTESGQRVKEIFVQEGQSVEAGEVLFQVDMEELKEQILTAQQELEKTKLQNQDAQSARNSEMQNRETAKCRAAEDYDQAVAQGDVAVAEAKAAWDAAEQALQEFLANQDSKGQNNSSEADGSNEADKSNEADGSNGADKNNGADKTNRAAGGNVTEDIQEAGETDNSDAEETGTGNTQANNPGGTDGTDEQDARKAALEQAAAEAKAAYEAAVSSRAENVKTAARALEDASAPVSSDSTAKQNEITRQQQELALGKLQDLQAAEGKVTAPVKGVVTQVAITTGDFTSDGTAVRLADTSKGSRLVVSVDKSNEAYISKGSQVKITASGKKEAITDYTVSNIAVNKEDQELLDVTVDLPQGVLEAGAAADIEIVQKSENYAAVLPVQALHEEQNSYYVLVLQEEQGVLGTQLVAKRLEVEVLDKNSTDVAVADGLLSEDQEVVKSSTRTIEEGSRVRKQES